MTINKHFYIKWNFWLKFKILIIEDDPRYAYNQNQHRKKKIFFFNWKLSFCLPLLFISSFLLNLHSKQGEASSDQRFKLPFSCCWFQLWFLFQTSPRGYYEAFSANNNKTISICIRNHFLYSFLIFTFCQFAEGVW